MASRCFLACSGRPRRTATSAATPCRRSVSVLARGPRRGWRAKRPRPPPALVQHGLGGVGEPLPRLRAADGAGASTGPAGRRILPSAPRPRRPSIPPDAEEGPPCGTKCTRACKRTASSSDHRSKARSSRSPMAWVRERTCGDGHGQDGQFVHARSFVVVKSVEHGLEHEAGHVGRSFADVEVVVGAATERGGVLPGVRDASGCAVPRVAVQQGTGSVHAQRSETLALDRCFRRFHRGTTDEQHPRSQVARGRAAHTPAACEGCRCSSPSRRRGAWVQDHEVDSGGFVRCKAAGRRKCTRRSASASYALHVHQCT